MVGKAIYGILTSASAVSALVSTRIYPDIIAQGANYPALAYTVVDELPTDTKDGVSVLDIASIQIDIYSDDYSEVQDIGEAVRAALDRYSGTVSSVKVDSAKYDGGTSGKYGDEKKIFWLSQDYSIRVKR